MRTVNEKNSKRLGFLGLLGVLAAAVALALPAVPASASVGTVWRVGSLSNATAAPGGTLQYYIEVVNVGDVRADGSTITVTAQLPPGLTGASASTFGGISCPGVAGAGVVTCTSTTKVAATSSLRIKLRADVSVGAEPGSLPAAAFEVTGGGAAAPARTVDPVRISSTPPGFGFDSFDGSLADSAGEAATQAAGHPDSQATAFDLNTAASSSLLTGERNPVENVKRVVVELPPGVVGNPSGVERCSIAQLSNIGTGFEPRPLCPPNSQVGTVAVRHSGEGALTFTYGPVPLYSMEPGPGNPARFGANVIGTVVLLGAQVRSDGDYGISVVSQNIPEGLAIVGTTVTIWDVAADEKHRIERACPGLGNPSEGKPTCESTAAPKPFLRNPTSCSAEGLENRIHADSWQHPGLFAEASYRSHEAPGYPFAPEAAVFNAGYSGPTERGEEVGVDGCSGVPFEPTLAVQPTTEAADSPSGLVVDLGVPQDCWDAAATPEEAEESICQSDLKDAEVTLPDGMSLNPSAAGGLAACTPAQVGLTTPVGQVSPIHFDEAAVSCPDGSKIGDVSIDTPLLEEPLTGAAYLAEQGNNPFGSLLSIYLVAEGSGVVVKQAGEIVADPATGRLTTRFADAPQLPFSNLHLELYGGPRAALRTPAACGAYLATGELTPWSGNPAVNVESAFEITEDCAGGFDPRLSGGSEDPLAGATSPFSLRLSREDGTQELGSLSVTTPPGVSGYLRGVPYCPDGALAVVSGELGTGAGQESSPACPAASRVGTVTVGAGAGPNPFYTESGRAYLAGPYKGAPISLAVVAPAVAGPFDLGTVVVRNALRIDPETAQITAVSDPLPTILHGIPVDLRDVRVDLDRDHFTVNPTNCEEMRIASTVVSTRGATANPSHRFQVSGCDKLAFKPKLSLRLKGQTRRAGHPGLRATLTMPQKGRYANVSKVTVSLPHSEFVAQNHLADVCTRVQYAEGAGGGAGCPARSIYGRVVAYSPLLDQPLKGKVYLRSNGGERELPDLVASLDGQIHIDAVGYIGVNRRTEGLKTTFATVPDAAVQKIVLTMPAGRHSLLENSTNICRGRRSAIVQIDAHNGDFVDSRSPVRVAGCGGGKSAGKHRAAR